MMETLSVSSSSQEIERILEPSTSSSSTNTRALEDQIENLKSIINNLREEVEKKELRIVKLVKDKEKINSDLLKQKRSNTSILKQLEDERKFYFQEKEIYCQEMNEIKELKKNLVKTNVPTEDRSQQDLRNELDNTRKKLKQTLEANYNLSIKFLRIKNTKSFLRNELGKLRTEHEKVFNDLKKKIEMLSSEVEDVDINKSSYLNVSPSNRKYVQLVRQNGSLVHENLRLQMEIERLNTQFDQIKLKYTKSETNKRLKYIHSIKSELQNKHENSKKERKKVRITSEDKEIIADEKSDKLSKPLKTNKSEIIKIFERSGSEDTPAIHVVNEDDEKRNHKKKHKPSCRKYLKQALPEDSKMDEAKENSTSHKPSSTTKLPSIAEIDENEKNS